MKTSTVFWAGVVLLSTVVFSYGPAAGERRTHGAIDLPVSTFQLKNGLSVVVNEDHSDPLIAVSILYHVGSGRETPGKTGFAHLFEHIMFQESQHVAQDLFFRKIRDAGGTLNGGTWEDGTIYFEVVPSNALEMVLWLESDRMGWLLSALDQQAFFNQQMVVINEKKQRYDNQPYGYREAAIESLMYGEGHPYSWQTIGTATDVANATLEDVRAFFMRWYGPNNATLVLSGDILPSEAEKLVEKYFGEIASGPKVKDQKAQPARLKKEKRARLEDRFARVAELTISWPTVPMYHRDEPALDFLADVLGDGKSAPLEKRLVEEKRLTGSVSASHEVGEVAGMFSIRVRAFEKASLQPILSEIDDVLAGFSPADISSLRLDRIKAQFETSFLERLESVFMKAMVLSMYAVFAENPRFIGKDLERYRKVQPRDVWQVYQRYLKARPRIVLSMVPAGSPDLAAVGSEAFVMADESAVVPRSPGEGGTTPEATKSVLDRSTEPAKGPLGEVAFPTMYRVQLASGLEVAGIEQSEVPLVRFEIEIPGGHSQDPMEKSGLAFILSRMLSEGTTRLDAAAFEEAVELLGAELSVEPGGESVWVTGACPSRNLDALVALVQEMLLSPRLDSVGFQRVADQARAELESTRADPNWVATVALQRLMYGDGNILGTSVRGSMETLASITLEDVRAHYSQQFRKYAPKILLVGDVSEAEAWAAFSGFATGWGEGSFAPVPLAPAVPASADAIYLVDFPGASQAVIAIGTHGPVLSDPVFYPLTVMNFSLGGDFSSVLNLILREEKGYTYGARSFFVGGRQIGRFQAGASVQGDSVAESLTIFLESMVQWHRGVPEELLSFTRNSLSNALPGSFETLDQLLSALRDIVSLGAPTDFVARRQETLRTVSVEDTATLATRYLPTDAMIIVVVGDEASLRPQLENLGWGPVVTVKPHW